MPNDENPVSTNSGNTIMQAYRFSVEIDGMLVGGFTQVNGLSVEVLTEEIHEGGVNGYKHRFVTGIKYSPLVLKRGVTNSNFFWDWCQCIVQGKIYRMNGSIVMLNLDGSEFRRWAFYDAYPVKWTGPEFDAISPNVAIESITLEHNGIKCS